DHAFVHGMYEPHGEEDEVGLDLELASRDGFDSAIDAHAIELAQLARFAPERGGQYGEVALGAFLVARRSAQFERPFRPGEELVLGERRLRQELEIGDRERALANGRADAVGAG